MRVLERETDTRDDNRALWTSFLPKTIERVRFNTAVCEIGDKGDHVLAVDTYLTRAKPISHDAAALFTVDILIFGQEGDMEIQVEGLTVASFSPTRPEDDHELYLTTVMDVDPEEAIVSLPKRLVPPSSVVLLESCERVASFYRGKALDSALLARASPLSLSLTPATSPRSSMASSMTAAESMTDEGFSSANPWPSETEESIDCFIRSSPWFTTLDFVRTLSKNLPDLLATMLPTVISEASYVHAFREHVARICRQIVHKYPGVHVLGLTDPRHSLTEHVIDAMKDSLGAYRVGSEPEANLMDRLPDQTVLRQKVFTQPLHLRGGVDESERTAPYDVVILSSSVIRDEDMHRTLKEIHSLMRPGGFLLLVQSPGTSLERRLATCGRMGSDSPGLATPPDWPDLLEDCGFANNIKNADQYDASGFSIAVRQRKSAYKNLFLNPSQHQASKRLTTKLVVVGGSTEHVGTLAACVAQQLHERCGRVELVQDLDAIDPADIASYSAVIFLADLDRPVLSNMNQARLDTLRSLLRPEMVMLWVTHDARSGNAEHAASFGFCRTMLAELPSLVLQNLDLESLATDWASDMITQTFARLALHARMEKAGGKKDSLWAYEPEIYTEHGQRLVPRVLPWKAANDRVNRPRRVIEYEVNTKERIVDIVPANGADGFRKHGTRVGSLPACADASSGDDFVEALYSCANAINSCHVVVGRGRRSGRVQVTLSRTNASYVSALSPFLALAQEDCGDVALLAAYLVRLLTVMAFADHAKDKSAVLLVEPDGMLYECARRVLSARGLVVQAYTARQEKQAKYPEMHYVQPWSSARELRDMLPVDGAEVLDLAEEASELSRTLRTKMPSNCEYRHHGDFAKHQRVLTEKAWNTAVRLATEMASASESSSDEAGLMSVDDWLQSAAHSEPFPLLDWRANRTVFHGVKPLAGERLLRPNRTYVLVGLTRDFGQSLCDLLVSQGARHIVLTSRNPPNRRPNWAEALQRKHGVQIRIEPMDVTMLDHVVAFKQRLAESGLPAVGGLVNGAMVLEDKVFSQMTAETLHRVLRPKTVGSANLDRVFDDADMDFFIMTSSFAAIGGHAGQSNYAAANMFMNGLAASRRRRGLPGSALNIGVIYGLGFLHREKEDLYQGLEREGYPPISERDLHHMFVEAMVAGRPAGGGGGGGDGAEPPVADITTGLRRFHAGSATPLHWHRDPRFSHYTAAAGDEDGLATGGGREKKQTVRDRLEGAATRDAMLAVLAPGFAHHLEALLQMPGGSVGGDVSIADLGVDSLVAVDIRAWIWKMTARDVAVMKVLGRDSIAKCEFDDSPTLPARARGQWLTVFACTVCEEIVDGMLADREAAKAAG